MSNNYGPKIVTDGLVLCLDAADQNSYSGSGNTWYDLSGNGNNGTFGPGTAAPTFSSGNGGSLVFDGGNDYCLIQNSDSVNISGSEITLEAFINVNNFGGGEAWIHKDLHYTIAFYPTTGGGYITYADSSNWSYTNFGFHGLFLTNTYYHIVATKVNNLVTIYSNGSVVVSKSFGGTISTTSNNLYIGSFVTTYYFNGSIYTARLYNKALSANEVQQNYNATKGRFGL